MQPISDLLFPIMANSYESIELDLDNANTTVAALFSVSIYWKDQIKDILPEGMNPMLYACMHILAKPYPTHMNHDPLVS